MLDIALRQESHTIRKENMNKRLPKEHIQIDPLALQIWEDVVYSMDTYTHDSTVSKFYLPEELTTHCRLVAAAFAQIHYAPIPKTEEIMKTRLFGLFYLTIICGIQTYLKERAIFTGYAPYTIREELSEIRELKNKIMHELEEGVPVDAPLSEVMDLFLHQLTPMKQKIIRQTKSRVFHEDLFDKFLPMILVWGYLFAKGMVLEY
jgi:hypothetical protein